MTKSARTTSYARAIAGSATIPVRIKIASENGVVRNAAPEYDDCRRVALEKGVPLKDVVQQANFEFLRQSFTRGEMWPVDPQRIDRLAAQGRITSEQAERFPRLLAIGSTATGHGIAWRWRRHWAFRQTTSASAKLWSCFSASYRQSTWQSSHC